MVRSKVSKLVCLCAGAAFALSAGLAFATGGVSAEQAIKARQGHLKELGAAFKDVRDELRKSAPNMGQIQGAATKISTLASDMTGWFPQGSGPESKLKTDAKAEIWKDPAGFEKALKNLQTEAPKLQQLAAANDLGGIKAQVGKLGGACKNCHDTYRVPQN